MNNRLTKTLAFKMSFLKWSKMGFIDLHVLYMNVGIPPIFRQEILMKQLYVPSIRSFVDIYTPFKL